MASAFPCKPVPACARDEFAFPCRRLPEDPAAIRRLGLYGQRQPGRFMQRVRLPLGRLSPGQLGGLAALASEFTPSTPLRLTIRQDLEFHDLRAEDIPPLQAGIHALGLTTVDACGDTIRNLVSCPEDGLRVGTWEVTPLAEAICRQAAAMPEGADLPRKFKISLSGSLAGCGRPWLNDFGVVIRPDGRAAVMLAGSLGARPGLAMPYAEALPLAEVPALFAAALRLFHQEGDRKNRHRARLRHVRERLGDHEFRNRIDDLFATAKAAAPWSPILLRCVAQAPPYHLRIQPVLGELTPAEAMAVAAAVTVDNCGELRLGLDLDLHLFTERPPVVPASLPTSWGDPVVGGAVIACPGTRWCAHGIADTRGLALRLQEARSAGFGGLTIAIAGCPNQCSHPAVAELGLVGRVKTVAGQPREYYRLLVGGGRGLTPDLALDLHSAIPAEAVPEVVVGLVAEFTGHGHGAAFAEFARPRADAWRRELAERFGEKLAP